LVFYPSIKMNILIHERYSNLSNFEFILGKRKHKIGTIHYFYDLFCFPNKIP
jgi:hypothetical protein